MFNPCGSGIKIMQNREQIEPSLYSIGAVCCSAGTIKCPNDDLYSDKRHKARILPNQYTKYEILDMINDEPAYVTLWAQKWQCNTCKKIFVDPCSPYKGKKSTSPDFNEYVASVFLSALHLEVEDLCFDLGITPAMVWKAVRVYRNRYQELREQMHLHPCSKVWLHKFYCYEKPFMLVVGEHRYNTDFVIFGICSCHVKDAIKAFNLCNSNNSVDVFITDAKNIAKELAILNLPFVDLTQGRYDELPPRIHEVTAHIDNLEERHFAFETIKFRIEMTDEYRRDELRRLGAGRFLAPREKCNFYIY